MGVITFFFYLFLGWFFLKIRFVILCCIIIISQFNGFIIIVYTRSCIKLLCYIGWLFLILTFGQYVLGNWISFICFRIEPIRTPHKLTTRNRDIAMNLLILNSGLCFLCSEAVTSIFCEIRRALSVVVTSSWCSVQKTRGMLLARFCVDM